LQHENLGRIICASEDGLPPTTAGMISRPDLTLHIRLCMLQHADRLNYYRTAIGTARGVA
jgi:hypothetical protein